MLCDRNVNVNVKCFVIYLKNDKLGFFCLLIGVTGENTTKGLFDT